MDVKFMYRCSDFTASPQGKLFLTLDKGIAMKVKTEEYQPRLEFILDKQRIWVDEELQTRKKMFKDEGEYKRWNQQKSFALETNSVSDCLIVKFYDMRGSELVLLGCEYMDVSALLLVPQIDKEDQYAHASTHEASKSGFIDDHDYENLININLKRINSQMSGEIIIKCNYRERIYSESSGAKGKQDITLKLREQMMEDMGLTKRIVPDAQE